MVANIVQAVIRSAIYHHADLNAFLNPTIDTRFFNGDPFINYPNNSYSSFFYSVMTLLTPFDRWFAALLWAVMNTAFYLLIIAMVNELIRQTQLERKKWSYFIAPLLTFAVFAINIHLGQSNILMLFGVMLTAFYLFKKNDLLSGLWLGFAIAFKTTPLIFMLFFFLKGKFRALAFSVLFFLIFMILVPMLFYSPSRNISFVTTWYELVLEPFVKGDKVKSANVGYYHANQSLDAWLNRYFTPYGGESYGGAHLWLDNAQYNEDQLRPFSNGIKLIIVIMIGFLAIKTRSIQNRLFPFELSLWLMAILFISPVSWMNHYILILPAYIVAINEILVLDKSSGSRKLLIWSIGVGTSIMLIGWGPYLQSFSPFFIGQFIFFIGFYVYSLIYAGKPRLASELERTYHS
jgi:hypothetical protein